MLPHTPLQPIVGRPFIILSSVESTNNYAMAKLHAGLAQPGTCFLAIRQTAGKGQRGKSWVASPGENITLSAVLPPPQANNQPFLLSATIALACYDFFENQGIDEVKIKWPNDLYWRDRKAGGILIENTYQGQNWSSSIAGIGINVNQTQFPSGVFNAVSLKQLTGKQQDIIKLGKQLCVHISERCSWMQRLEAQPILDEYNNRLFRRGQSVRLKKGNDIIETVIRGVLPSGELITEDSITRKFSFGEVQWV